MIKRWLVRDLTMVDSNGKTTQHHLQTVVALMSETKLHDVEISDFSAEEPMTEYLGRCTLRQCQDGWIMIK